MSKSLFEVVVILVFVFFVLFHYQLSPTANVTAAASARSKLGLHTSFQNGDAWRTIQEAKPAVVKLFGEYRQAAEIKQVSPCTFIVARTTQPQNSQRYDGAPEDRAQDWFNTYKDTIQAYPRIDCWEGYNEPPAQNADQMRWIGLFEKKRVELLATINAKACIGSFPVGNPSIPDTWREFYPAFQAAKEKGGFLALHEYGPPSNMQCYFSGDGPWLNGRYRKVYNQYLIPDGLVIPLVMTEAGIDGGLCDQRGCECNLCRGDAENKCGWRAYGISTERYMNDLRWYDSVIKEDSYVIGATIYQTGIPGWRSFETSPELTQPLITYINQVPAPTPPNCPVTSAPPPPPPVQKGTVAGTVTDENTGFGIGEATIRIVSTGITGRPMSPDGEYTIPDVPAGTYTVTASASGYLSQSKDLQEVRNGETTTVNFELIPVPPLEACSPNCYIGDEAGYDKLCAGGTQNICGGTKNYGDVVSCSEGAAEFDALCRLNRDDPFITYHTWSECNTDAPEKGGPNGDIADAGTVCEANGRCGAGVQGSYLCAQFNGAEDTWVACGTDVASGGDIVVGSTTYNCCSGVWQTTTCGVTPPPPPPPPTPVNKCTACGRPCLRLDRTIGQCTAALQCIGVQSYVDGKRCCADEDCSLGQQCTNGACGAAVSPGCANLAARFQRDLNGNGQPDGSDGPWEQSLQASSGDSINVGLIDTNTMGYPSATLRASGPSFSQTFSSNPANFRPQTTGTYTLSAQSGSCTAQATLTVTGTSTACADSTSLSACSATKPKYCDASGTLQENYCFGPDRVAGNADDCGCSSGACQADGRCGTALPPPPVADGGLIRAIQDEFGVTMQGTWSPYPQHLRWIYEKFWELKQTNPTFMQMLRGRPIWWATCCPNQLSGYVQMPTTGSYAYRDAFITTLLHELGHDIYFNRRDAGALTARYDAHFDANGRQVFTSYANYYAADFNRRTENYAEVIAYCLTGDAVAYHSRVQPQWIDTTKWQTYEDLAKEITGGLCKTSVPPDPVCSDGTALGACSSQKPLHCMYRGDLVEDCEPCGCAAGRCDTTSGRCISSFTISGTVSDVSGNPLPDAVLTLTENRFYVIARSRTDGSGRFSIPDVPQSTYELFSRKECFESASETIDLAADYTKNFRLNDAVLGRVEINPASSQIEANQKMQFSGAAFDANNRGMPARFSWSSDNTNIGTVTSTGEFEGRNEGSTTVRVSATCGATTRSASATVTVLPSGSIVLKRCSEADASTPTKVDYVLIPEQSYTSIDEFKRDVETNYVPKLFSISPIDANKQKFNIYYYEEKAVCDRDGPKGTKLCTLPSNLGHDCPFADIKAVIHKGTWRDYAMRDRTFTANSPITQVHEIGHALFDLADEYCCDGGYEMREPYPNIFVEQNSCQQQLDDNGIAKRCKRLCKDEDQGASCILGCDCINWYRQEGKSIMNNQFIYEQFSENNLLRVNDVFGVYSSGSQTTPQQTSLASCMAITSPGTYVIGADLRSGDTCMTIQSSDVTLDCAGKKLEGTGYRGSGIRIEGSGTIRNVEVKNCIVKGYETGIIALNGETIRIKDNDVSDNYDDTKGWTMSKCTEDLARIGIAGETERNRKCDICFKAGRCGVFLGDPEGTGIHLKNTKSSVIENTIAHNTGIGIWLESSDSNQVKNNDVSYSTAFGIYLLGASNSVVENNIANDVTRNCAYWCSETGCIKGCDATGIILESRFRDNENNIIRKNTVLRGGDGIFLKPGGTFCSNNNEIAENDVSGAFTNCIEVTFCNGNRIKSNKAHNCPIGLWLGYATNTLVEGNEFISNANDAINAENSKGNTIKRNVIRRGGRGIYLWKNPVTDPIIEGRKVANPQLREPFPSSNHIIERNTIENERGIEFTDTDTTEIRYNTIKTKENIMLTRGSSGVKIFSNNLLCENCLFSVKNDQDITVNAQYDWWGTADTAQIERMVYHKTDNTAVGEVYYTPTLSGTYV